VDGDPFVLLGDALWLDFLNTTRGREKDPPDRLQDARAWSQWCEAVRLADPADDFPAVLGFRTRLLDLATALASSTPPPSASIRALNQRLGDIVGRQQLVRIAGQWQLPFMPSGAPGTLESIARSAADTLALPLAAVRICAGPTCSLFLLDHSPQLTRRWCSPTHCGRGMRVERRRRSAP
jgi:predicted RNA-binding Zn ribbon-like protein